MIGIILALAVLVLPLQWFLAIVLAAVFHELCHYLAVKICGGKFLGLEFGAEGARMEVWGLSDMQELICALAGPVGGLCLLPFVRWIPRMAICAACQSLFNLIPVYPLDGGRAMMCLLNMFMPKKADRISLWVRRFCLLGIAGLGLYGTLALGLGAFPMAVTIMIFAKIACKPDRH